MKKMNYAQRRLTGLSLILLALSGCCGTSAPPTAAAAAATPLAAPGPEQIFASPEDAAHALVEASRQNDKPALLKILGMQATKIISSGDAVADKESRRQFVSAYDRAHKFESDDKDREFLVIGDEEWPLPIPLVHVADAGSKDGWQFDTAAGKDEILNRRIGRDELNAIEICHTYVLAQRDYAAQNHAEYAQHFMSHGDKHDGLYWPVKAGEQESPLGPLVADARAEGYTPGQKHSHYRPYHGYFYKILKAQGENAAGGASDYVVHGHMTGGFALIAFPAKYEDSGVMTFIVNQNGIVFQKNLGPETEKVARQITQYDPDASWNVVSIPQE